MWVFVLLECMVLAGAAAAWMTAWHDPGGADMLQGFAVLGAYVGSWACGIGFAVSALVHWL